LQYLCLKKSLAASTAFMVNISSNSLCTAISLFVLLCVLGKKRSSNWQQPSSSEDIDLNHDHKLCSYKACFTARPQAYTAEHPKLDGGPPFSSRPLLNFLWFLLLSIQTSQSLSVYSVLCDKYKAAIEKDPQYLEYLDKIGQVNLNMLSKLIVESFQHFFGVPAPVKPKAGGMFSGLFDQLLSAMNEDSEGEEAEAVSGPSTSAGGPRSVLCPPHPPSIHSSAGSQTLSAGWAGRRRSGPRRRTSRWRRRTSTRRPPGAAYYTVWSLL
jgi:hypothetical protein